MLAHTSVIPPLRGSPAKDSVIPGHRLSSRIFQSTAVRAVALGLAYAGIAQLVGLLSSFGSTQVASFWPASGMTLAVLIRSPRRQWPWLLAAVATAEGVVDFHEGLALGVCLAWALANAVEPTVSALLLSRIGRARPNLASHDGLLAFLGCAVFAGPAAGAVIGGAASALGGIDSFATSSLRWLVGDGIGVLIVGPALLSWHHTRNRRQTLHRAEYSGIIVGVAALAFAPWPPARAGGLPYLIIPTLVICALRGGHRGAALGVLAVGLITNAATAAGLGPFAASEGPFAGLIVAQMFIAVSAFSAYIVAALTADLVSRDELAARLRIEADHDPLTGLANRRRFYRDLGALTERRGVVLALLYIDLDRFKAVNDDFGHATGDRLLVETARRIEHCVRPTDIVARVGGDEFLVVAHVIEPGDADKLAARIETALAEPIVAAGRAVRVTASIGVVTVADGETDADTLVADADRAMFAIKGSESHAALA